MISDRSGTSLNCRGRRHIVVLLMLLSLRLSLHALSLLVLLSPSLLLLLSLRALSHGLLHVLLSPR